MYSRIYLLLFLMLASGCSCTRYAGGFRTHAESRLVMSAGVAGTIKRGDSGGFEVVGDGDAVLGANWKGGAYSGGYVAVDDKYYGANALATGQVARAIQHSVHTKLGRDGQGNWHRDFEPTTTVLKNKKFTANGNIVDGVETNHLAAINGDDKSRNDYTELHQTDKTPSMANPL